jgi:uncharacterized membrane protein
MGVADPIYGLPTWLAPLLDPFRLLLGIALVLAPGLVLGRALMEESVERLPRLAWGVGAGFAVLMAGGLVLNAVQALNGSGWMIWLTIVFLATLAIMRCFHPSKTYTPDRGGDAANLCVSASDLWMLAMAAFIAVCAFFVARSGADDASHKPNTEIWAQPNQGEILFGLRNREGSPMNYRIELRSASMVIDSWEVSQLLPDSVYQRVINRNFSKVDEISSLQIALTMATERSPWQILLFRAGDDIPYRHLTLAQ